ncbi:MAG TPA: NYN domain-containing protein [Thermoanaerobaculia bacterium]|nr:NYN domain-containing protein [Thermoanaerobaculia bacterium]
MTPWWLRPTAEGASKEETPQEPIVPAVADPDPEPAESPEPVVEAAAAAPIVSIAPASPVAPAFQILPPSPAPPVEPAAPAEPVWRPWRTTPDEIAPPVSSMLDREPEPAPAFFAPPPSPFLAPAEPVEPAASEPVSVAPIAPIIPIAPIASVVPIEPITPVAVVSAADPAVEATPETAETEEAREGRRRSRRRGGRRRNGRGAGALDLSPASPDDEEEDDDEIEAPIPAPAPIPIAPPTRRAPMQQEEVVLRRRETAFDYDGMGMGPREIVVTMPERRSADERKIALFCDLENVALGVRDSEIKKFDIELVLERLLEKGKIIVKKAYADWERYSDYKRPFHEAAIELIDIPQKHYSGKNSADIKMVVDAMDLSYSKEHLDTFVLLSGDSDFSPLVSKLKENNKYVIGIGVKSSSSALLIDNCDEFIFYEDVWRDQQKAPHVVGVNKKSTEAFSLMVESIQALLRENKDVLWGSMIKQTMQRKKPAFNEGYYGYSTFSELLEDAERNNVIKLKKDQRSGTYIVTGFSGSKR